MNTILSLFPLKIRISKKLLQNSMIKIRRFVWECMHLWHDEEDRNRDIKDKKELETQIQEGEELLEEGRIVKRSRKDQKDLEGEGGNFNNSNDQQGKTVQVI